MNPEIRNRFTNDIIVPAGKYASLKEAVEKEYKNLSSADLRYADLRSADLRSADLRYADLSSADLRYADLSSADLSSADLRYADLSSADLRSADLRSADLRYAEYKEPIIYSDLFYLLTLQPNITLHAWKYLKDGKSPYQNKEYEVGKTYTFKDINEDKFELCGKGGNVATLNWCLKDNLETNEFLEVEFNTKDMIVPYFSDGKFRVKSFKTLRKITRTQALKLIK